MDERPLLAAEGDALGPVGSGAVRGNGVSPAERVDVALLARLRAHRGGESRGVAFESLSDGAAGSDGGATADLVQRRCFLAWNWVSAAFWEGLRACGFMVDEVDAIRASQRASRNIWDSQRRQAEFASGSSVGSRSSWSGEDGSEGYARSSRSHMQRHNVLLAFGIVSLVVVTALEPILIKVMADHAIVDELRDYRYVLAQLLILSHVPLAIGSAIWYACKYSLNAAESCDFPKTWFILLALLNSLHMIMLVVPVGQVPAPLAILLPHAVIPVAKLFGAIATAIAIVIQRWFPSLPEALFDDENPYSVVYEHYQVSSFPPRNPHQRHHHDLRRDKTMLQAMAHRVKHYARKRGWTLVSVVFVIAGLIVGLYPVLTDNVPALGKESHCHFYHKECEMSTIVFLLAALPAALSAVCQERSLVSYSVPVSPMLLHGWLVPIEFLFGVLWAPVGRHLQHPTRPWRNISTEIRGLDDEVIEGLQCILLGKESGIGVIGHSDPNWCKPLLPLLVMFLLVSFSYHVLTLYVMKHGSEIALRIATAAAIPIGWGVLAFYDVKFQPDVSKDVPTEGVISVFSKIAMVCIVLGLLFHRTVGEPETDYFLTSPFEERDRMSMGESTERHRRALLEQRHRNFIEQLPEPLMFNQEDEFNEELTATDDIDIAITPTSRHS